MILELLKAAAIVVPVTAFVLVTVAIRRRALEILRKGPPLPGPGHLPPGDWPRS